MPRGRLLGVAGFALLLFLLLAGAPARLAAEGIDDDKFKIGDKAPEFSQGAFLGGGEPKLADLAGSKVLLLNFWGLRCGACLEEMPFLEDLWKRYADRGLVIWGVNTDGVDPATVVETLREVKVSVSYPLIVDPEFAITDLYTNFLVPLTIVIDRGGLIRYIHTGFEKGTEKEYEAAVKKELGR